MGKKSINISEDQIEIPLEENQSKGCAFVLASSEEQAKLASAVFNEYQLDKKHKLSACQAVDFEKFMQAKDEVEMPKQTTLIELKAHIRDTKKEQFLVQSGKDVYLKAHTGSAIDYRTSSITSKDDNVINENIQSDKSVQWSPKGTYLIVIKHDKIDFFGGEDMQPIITIPEAKVDYVSMSPCERYVLTYSAQAKSPFIVWNFQLVEMIREFDQLEGEDMYSYQWSMDGNYIAKKFKKEVQKGEGEKRIKTGLSVYTLPSMELLTNVDEQKKSITIDGIQDFLWAPHTNIIAYTAFPSGNVLPSIGFLEIPSRREIALKTMMNSLELKLFFHPQGDYLAVMNKFKEKKTIRYSVEIFVTKNPTIPHQQVIVDREVIEFNAVYWEPYHSKFAIHTNSKRKVEAGKKEYTLGAMRNGVDIYEVREDPLKGFLVKTIGFLNSEKVTGFAWSGAGCIFNTIESEGSKQSVSFYMITEESPSNLSIQQQQNQQKKKFEGSEQKFEFKKTARHEIYESRFEFCWDISGRYLSIYGQKRSSIDKSDKSIIFYNIFGQPLLHYEKVPNLTKFIWRPRPTDILNQSDIQKLKKEFKTKYQKKFKDEEKVEKQEVMETVKKQKREVMDEFLNNFFIPLRQEFEKNRQQFEAMFPIKKDDFLEQPQKQDIIYSFDKVISEIRL